MDIVLITLAVVLVIVLALSVRIVQQYERGVVFRFGAIKSAAREPGLRFIIPVVERMQKVSVQTIPMTLEPQRIITKDNLTVTVAAVTYYKVTNPIDSLVKIDNLPVAIYQLAQTTMRSIVGQSELDQILSDTQEINDAVKERLDASTGDWGAEVTKVEIRDISLPESMERAMAAQPEAEREKRAKITAAEGEKASAAILKEAADTLGQNPTAVLLRGYQVLNEISKENNSTIVFPSDALSGLESIIRKTQQ